MKACSQKEIERHVEKLLRCRICPQMHRPSVSGRAVRSRVILVGQAPGDKEPKMGRPFAWTAGKTLFKWFLEYAHVTEEEFRSTIYMAAVCRCFPGKKETGGDRVPHPQEIQNCSSWLNEEISLLKPGLLIPVGKLAIQQFLPPLKLEDCIGEIFQSERQGHRFDVIPLPHPSGASPWHRMEPGKSLLQKAMKRILNHPDFQSRSEV